MSKRTSYTVQCERNLTDRDGKLIKRQFIQYSAPTSLTMARALAEHLRRINQSWRIVTDDGRPSKKGRVNIIEFWHRENLEPDEEKTGE